jgi:hypothetical protein
MESIPGIFLIPDSTVTALQLPDLPRNSVITLSQARNAHCFAISSFIRNARRSGSGSSKDVSGDQTLKDLLIVGCRKKVVVYGSERPGLKDPYVRLPHHRSTALMSGIAAKSFP